MMRRPKRMTMKGQSFSHDAHQTTPSRSEMTPARMMRRPKKTPQMWTPRPYPKQRSSPYRLRYSLRGVGRRAAPQLLQFTASSSFSAPHFQQ